MLTMGLVAACVLAPDFVASQESPPDVTSDTLAYCITLEQDLARVAEPPEGVERLIREGHAMCARGEVRGGIVRMRRALIMSKVATRTAKTTRSQ